MSYCHTVNTVACQLKTRNSRNLLHTPQAPGNSQLFPSKTTSMSIGAEALLPSVWEGREISDSCLVNQQLSLENVEPACLSGKEVLPVRAQVVVVCGSIQLRKFEAGAVAVLVLRSFKSMSMNGSTRLPAGHMYGVGPRGSCADPANPRGTRVLLKVKRVLGTVLCRSFVWRGPRGLRGSCAGPEIDIV